MSMSALIYFKCDESQGFYCKITKQSHETLQKDVRREAHQQNWRWGKIEAEGWNRSDTRLWPSWKALGNLSWHGSRGKILYLRPYLPQELKGEIIFLKSKEEFMAE